MEFGKELVIPPFLKPGTCQPIEPEKTVVISETEYKRYIAAEATLRNIRNMVNETDSDTEKRRKERF